MMSLTAEAPAEESRADAMAEAASSCSGVGGQGEEWALKRYGRLGGKNESTSAQERVFESNEESGSITLSILNTGHFFISQGHTLLEGFSLVSAKTWLKVGKKSDCLLFGSKAKDESRMFRVQFNGESKQKAQENCESCYQKLHYYLKEQIEPSEKFPEERIHVGQIAQSMLNHRAEDLGSSYQYPALGGAELGPFLKICLLDKDFPAFVEAIEKELNKLAQK
ncbi:meiotic recombination protein REC114 [Pseudophryne corroboree]|uniref:meiotic recombination protein REC114 n=1 Tax=Pseudophryne corroboree TaxID=495146 RepID=UPI003081C8F4